MPEINTWPVSWSVRTLNVGSSSARRTSALSILSWSILVLGSTEIEITGSGNLMVSKDDGVCQGSHRVSPVKVSFRPTIAGDVARVYSQ